MITSGHHVDLYWLPLGAGGRSVRLNGKVFEACSALIQHRSACDLFHSGLEVHVDGERFVIEMAPAWDADGARRGVVVEGPVGARWAGRWRMFRYEIRRWRGGHIPDVAEAVDSPQRLSDDPIAARRVLDFVAEVPAMTWGRDELAAGEMWNSNSVVSWLLAKGGIDPSSAELPAHGRAPGWHAGLVAAGDTAVRDAHARRVSVVQPSALSDVRASCTASGPSAVQPSTRLHSRPRERS